MRQAVSAVGALMLLAAGCAPSLRVAPRLIASWPMPGASMDVSRQVLDLTFNRELDASATWVVVSGDDGAPLPSDAALDPNDARHLKIRLLDPVAGNFDLHWHAVAADSQLAGDGDESFVLHGDVPAPPRIDVSPSTVDDDERLELVGKGFAPSSALQLTVADDRMQLASTKTDEHGKFNVEARVPGNVPYGTQPIWAVDGEGRTAVGTVTLRHGGWPPVVASDVGQPGPLAGEVTFTVAVRNLSDYVLEHVSVAIADPPGASLVQADSGAQVQDGSVSWLVSTLDRDTVGPFRATYRVDHPVTSHARIDFRHRPQRGCTDECVPAFISSSVADSTPVAPEN
jgi:methionine-rich copper-binding protein CopC